MSCLPSPKGLAVISHDTRYRYRERERERWRDVSDVSLRLKRVQYKSHVITRGHQLIRHWMVSVAGAGLVGGEWIYLAVGSQERQPYFM